MYLLSLWNPDWLHFVLRIVLTRLTASIWTCAPQYPLLVLQLHSSCGQSQNHLPSNECESQVRKPTRHPNKRSCKHVVNEQPTSSIQLLPLHRAMIVKLFSDNSKENCYQANVQVCNDFLNHFFVVITFTSGLLEW